jgi:hypothetical protein
VSGVATFYNLSIDKVGSGYTLTASSSGLTGATSNEFNITPGTPTKLAFVQQPTTAVAGVVISPAVQVAVQDANGNTVTSNDTAQITLTIGSNPGGGTLSGTTTRTVRSGVATFSNLCIDKVGSGYTLTASSSGLTGATSNAFNVITAPTQLAFVQQPPVTGYTNTALVPAITVRLLDANGQPVSKGGIPVTLAIGSNPGGGTLSGILTRNTNTSGVVIFGGLSINTTGTGYTLTASSAGLTGTTSNAFTMVPGPTQLTFIQQPTNVSAGQLHAPPTSMVWQRSAA